MRAFFVLFILMGGLPITGATASSSSVASFKSVKCEFSNNPKTSRAIEASFIPIMIDGEFARLVQISLVGAAGEKIQYQLLIEKDPKKTNGFLILQNLLVGTLESSVEFTTTEIGLLRVAQGIYSFKCTIKN